MMYRAFSSAALIAMLGGVVFAWQKPQAPKTPPAKPQAAQTPAIPASAIALTPEVNFNDTLRMHTHKGSFRIVPKSPTNLPAGRLDVAFTGTVLVTGLEKGSYMKTFGDVHEEYHDEEHGKQVFFGKGRILVVGKFQNCQWFGRDLDFTFQGSAIVRIWAEFDANMDTGEYWFDAARKYPLQNVQISLNVPTIPEGAAAAVSRADFERQKKLLKKRHGG